MQIAFCFEAPLFGCALELMAFPKHTTDWVAQFLIAASLAACEFVALASGTWKDESRSAACVCEYRLRNRL